MIKKILLVVSIILITIVIACFIHDNITENDKKLNDIIGENTENKNINSIKENNSLNEEINAEEENTINSNEELPNNNENIPDNDTTDTSNEDSTQDDNNTNENPPPTPTCTPKKFPFSFARADFNSLTECKDMGSKYLNGSYGYICDSFVDDCGDTYYMLTLYEVNTKVEYDYHQIPIPKEE